MRSKYQNAYLYKTALSPDFRVFKPSRLGGICNDAELSFFYEGSRLNLKTTPRNCGPLLTRIISAEDVVSNAFLFLTGNLKF